MKFFYRKVLSFVLYLLPFGFFFFFFFFLQIKPLFIFQLCPRIHQKKFSHRRVYERPSSPAPGFNIKFNKAQRVSDLPKVINAGRARVRFAFFDSWPIVVLKHLIQRWISLQYRVHKIQIYHEEDEHILCYFLKHIVTSLFWKKIHLLACC